MIYIPDPPVHFHTSPVSYGGAEKKRKRGHPRGAMSYDREKKSLLFQPGGKRHPPWNENCHRSWKTGEVSVLAFLPRGHFDDEHTQGERERGKESNVAKRKRLWSLERISSAHSRSTLFPGEKRLLT
jgi:hypothetical protein